MENNDTRTRILETALTLFLKHGYEATSMRMLAQELGLTKPAIYYYFPGKEDLALHVVELFEQRMGEWAACRHAGAGDFFSHLRSFMEAIPVFSSAESVVLGEEHAGEYRLGFNDLVSALAIDNPAIRERMAAMFTHTRARLARLAAEAAEQGSITPDADPEALAFIIHALVEGMYVLAHFDPTLDVAAISGRIHNELERMLKRS